MRMFKTSFRLSSLFHLLVLVLHFPNMLVYELQWRLIHLLLSALLQNHHPRTQLSEKIVVVLSIINPRYFTKHIFDFCWSIIAFLYKIGFYTLNRTLLINLSWNNNFIIFLSCFVILRINSVITAIFTIHSPSIFVTIICRSRCIWIIGVIIESTHSIQHTTKFYQVLSIINKPLPQAATAAAKIQEYKSEYSHLP